jgi:elongation factor 3
LQYYKGNLSEFVKVRPEAMTYFELTAAKTTFRFPPPGPLEGINSKGKPILKMTDITVCSEAGL